MIGVVLSGGQSSRMGEDKGLKQLNGKRWAEIIREKFASLSIQSIISINKQQVDQYSIYFERGDLLVDDTSLKINGPLTGLLSTHLTYPEQDLLVIACDMINIQTIIIEKLQNEYHVKQKALAFKGESIEPLCAIYPARGVAEIHSKYNSGLLTKHSMMHVLDLLNADYIPIKTEWQPYFKNFNRADDI
jgi:molybdopterin-guanine dinucleotide biosynthesis protein A